MRRLNYKGTEVLLSYIYFEENDLTFRKIYVTMFCNGQRQSFVVDPQYLGKAMEIIRNHQYFLTYCNGRW